MAVYSADGASRSAQHYSVRCAAQLPSRPVTVYCQLFCGDTGSDSQVVAGGVGWSVVAGLVGVVYFGARLKAVRVCLDLALTVPIKSRMSSMPPVAQSVISPLTRSTQSTLHYPECYNPFGASHCASSPRRWHPMVALAFRALRPGWYECNAQAWVRHGTAHRGTTGFIIRLIYEDVLMAMSYFAGKREQLAAKVSQASADLSWSSRNNKANTQTIRVE